MRWCKPSFLNYKDFILLRLDPRTLSRTPLVHSDVAAPIVGDDEEKKYT